MRTAIVLTLLISGLIVRVCLTLHNFLDQPAPPRQEILAEQDMPVLPQAGTLPKESIQETSKEPQPLPSSSVAPQTAAMALISVPEAPKKTQTVLVEAKYSEACLQGDSHSCQLEADQKKKSCEEGNLIDCSTLAWMYLQGAAGITPAPELAIALLEDACNRGGRQACSSLGMIYSEGKAGIIQDEEKAISAWKKNCTMNNTTNCYELALMYHEGKGNPADKDEVIPLMLQSCDDNHIAACKWLAENSVTQFSAGKTTLTLK